MALKLYGDQFESIYVASDGQGWHKVGVTAHPEQRARGLSYERRMPVAITFLSTPRQKAGYVEVTAHWLLAKHDNAREWFRVDKAAAIAAITEATAMVDAGHRPHSRFAYTRRKAVGEELDRRLRAAMHPGESRQAFIDAAVEREIAHREAVAEKLARDGSDPEQTVPTRVPR